MAKKKSRGGMVRLVSRKAFLNECPPVSSWPFPADMRQDCKLVSGRVMEPLGRAMDKRKKGRYSETRYRLR